MDFKNNKYDSLTHIISLKFTLYDLYFRIKHFDLRDFSMLFDWICFIHFLSIFKKIVKKWSWGLGGTRTL